MAEQAAQGHGLVRVLLAFVKARADVELLEGVLQRRIQAQPALFDQLQGRRGGQQFGEGAGAKRGVIGDPHAVFLVGITEAPGPDQLLAGDQGNGQPRDLALGHFLGDLRLQVTDDAAVVTLFEDRCRRRWLAVASHAAQQEADQGKRAERAEHGTPGSNENNPILGPGAVAVFECFVGKLSKSVKWLARPRLSSQSCPGRCHVC